MLVLGLGVCPQVPFEAHVFPNTSHCEKDVESEESVENLSIPFVAKHAGLVLKN